MCPLIRLSRAAIVLCVTAALLGTSCRYVREEKLPESGATLEGTVKYGNETVQFAMIQVQSDKATATGKIGEDGRYRVENVPVGEVNIAVNTSAAEGDYQAKLMAGGVYKGPDAKAPGRVSGPTFIKLPGKYSDPTTSGIKTTINPGANTFDIVIPK